MKRRLSDEAYAELLAALAEFRKEVEGASKDGRLRHSTAETYLSNAEIFVRWLGGKYEPGHRSRRRG